MATRRTQLRTALMVATVLLSLSGTRAVSDEQLSIACDDMTPRHTGYKPENVSPSAANPYRLLLDTQFVVPGNLVNVTLVPANGIAPQYKGFMIQARDANDRVIGTFLPACGNSDKKPYHMLTCSNGNEPYNTVVQSSNSEKVHETFTWVAPVSLDGPFIFKYTVVLDYEHFWTNEETPVIPVVPLSAEEYQIKSSINHQYYIYQLYLKNCYF